MEDIQKFFTPIPVSFREPRRRLAKVAPGVDFDFNRPEECQGICLGSCIKNGRCPFNGCPVDASAFGSSESRH